MSSGRESPGDDSNNDNNIVRVINSKPVKIVDSNVAAGLAQTTGWKTWGSALVAGKLLSSENKHGWVENKTVLDLSSGNGVVALICAALGAQQVVATECKTCIKILERNIELNVNDSTHWLPEGKIIVKECGWGETLLDHALVNRDYDLVILSDLVFIAVRDSIMDELIHTLLQIVTSPSTKILLIYEERILEGEEEFLNKLKLHFVCDKIALSNDLLEWLDNDGDGSEIGNLFYERPAIQIFVCTLKPGN